MKLGKNTNAPYPKCERSIKIHAFKQQRGQLRKEGGKWGKIGKNFARCAGVLSFNVLTSYVMPVGMKGRCSKRDRNAPPPPPPHA